MTGPDGTYEFLNVPYDTYWLNETLILGWKQITPNTQVTLNETNSDFTYNFINAEDETCCVCPPTASFSYVKSGQKVQFTDTSTGPHAVRWIWFFGDGTISTVEDPVKTYKVPGTYTVRLYITWADCDGVTYQWKSASQRIRVP
jgi:PKD repeat protein